MLRFLIKKPTICSLRSLCTKPLVEDTLRVDKTLLAKLRKKTRFPINKCKDALIKCKNDFSEAEKYMKKVAQEEGWEKASRLGERPMSQGLVGLIHDQNMAAMVEVNCETDFVARNEQFRKLVHSLASSCLQIGQAGNNTKVVWDADTVQKLEVNNKALADLVAMEIGLIGENMAISRAAFLRGSSSVVIGSFVHTSGEPIIRERCIMGKFGGIVSVSPLGSSTENDAKHLQAVSNILAQQVVGMNPTSIGDVSTTDTGQQAEGEAVSDDSKAQTPRIKKKKKSNDEESRLLYQEFIMDEEQTVAEYCTENEVRVRDFIRFECGEDLDT